MENESTVTFSYSIMEKALARIFRVHAGSMTVLRGRIKALHRSGIAPSNPGRGKVIQYKVEDCFQMAVALGFVDFGLTPSAIAGLMAQSDFFGFSYNKVANENSGHTMLCMLPHVFSNNDIAQFVLLKRSKINQDTVCGFGGRVALIDLEFLRHEVETELAPFLSIKAGVLNVDP